MSALTSAIFLTLLGIFACTVLMLVKINQMTDIRQLVQGQKGAP